MKKLLYLLLISVAAHAQSPGIIQQTLIFPQQEKHVHGSSLVSLNNGDFLAAWFQGSGERTADDVKIMGARLKKGEKNWSAPFLMADTPNIPDCNPVLFLNAEGKLFLVWIAVQANLWEQSILRFRTSVDFGRTGAPVWNWQDNILLKPDQKFAEEIELKFKDLPEFNGGWAGYAPKYDELIVEASKDATKRSIGWMTRIKPLLLPNGKIVLPLYSDGFNMSIMAISDDNGTSWLPGLPLVGRGPIQPAVVKRKNGNLVAYARDSGDEPNRVHFSESADNGKSWTASKKTDIPNTASVELLVLQDGKWAFLGNDIDNGRHQLSLRISDDEGKTWKWKTFVENDESKKGGYSYPSLIQTKDGLLHMTYSYHPEKTKKSIRYVVVDPKKLY
ncbi:sialidase family protein [Dyadobacter psychrotolerans]|uniref:Exo-alpha-sialidase n=1 Tax=Dyadobacter psychrotolerans TaxID=2541721 RepID=A0A4R5DIB5_9BACT|nr:sialidase family protein [Dyadobacter psychrotolerans]TDE11654.1 exo-alpha-sialidase [Dyadobacter psychrotolerans]